MALEVYIDSLSVFLQWTLLLRFIVKFHCDEGGPLIDPLLYYYLVGSHNYMTITCPAISFAAQQVSQFMHSPCIFIWPVVQLIICFFEDTSICNLFLPMEKPASVGCYSVADLAGYLDTKRSITSWCVYLGPTLLSWKCGKQSCVSKSSTELEY
ncbi:hypothetical protein V8G54_030542 [Vigna mungo]|uniref:Uncharacterized protein n=1 Tax=Vigna mungo TaxID=3915 RepID=A0AAQ3MWJ7_VIGMU